MHAIEKSLDILEAVLKHKEEITITSIARTVGQRVSTTHRICSILVKRGYLYHKENGGKYSLGYKFLLFNGNIANTSINIKTEAFPLLKELSKKISETVVLAVLDGIEPVDIISVVPDTILKATPGLGTKSPFHCTSVGKVFIAFMPNETIERILNSMEFTAYTDRTITDFNRLKIELNTIRIEDVAFDDEEYIMGLRSAAAPIRNENGEVFASVCYLAPSIRVSSSKMKQLAPLLKNCAYAISRSFGYNGKKLPGPGLLSEKSGTY